MSVAAVKLPQAASNVAMAVEPVFWLPRTSTGSSDSRSSDGDNVRYAPTKSGHILLSAILTIERVVIGDGHMGSQRKKMLVGADAHKAECISESRIDHAGDRSIGPVG